MALRFVFFGSPPISCIALDEMGRAGKRPLAVVCQPDRPAGRGRELQAPATKCWAEKKSVEIFQPQRCKEPAFLERLAELAPDLGLVFAFGQLLPERLLSIPRLGFINIHPSLLPRWRGAAPVQWAILAGDARTGVSIVRVTPRLDDGEILLQEQVDILPEENAAELAERLSLLGGRLAAQAIDGLEKGTLVGRPQDESQVAWARALEKKDGLIDWRRPAEELHRQIRGVQPWPGASTRLGEKILKIHRAGLRPDLGGQPGEVLQASGDALVVAAGRGALALQQVQLEGKRRMSAREFLLGKNLAAGERLG